VHRDVKPSNLMLDETGRIRILDFGLAQLSYWDEASIELTSVGQLMGTLDYMAPEQAELCGGVDYRADLYAMGATLFRLLCGRPPLAAVPNQSPLEKLRLLSNHQPPKLDTLCPDAPPQLVKLAASLLARSTQDRPASAAHVAEELAEFTESANPHRRPCDCKRAQEKEVQSPELIGSERHRRNMMQAMVRSVDAELQDGERRSTGGLTPPRSPENVGGSRVRRWIIAAVHAAVVVCRRDPDQTGNRQGPARD
jgi:serine/threonine protein kinase